MASIILSNAGAAIGSSMMGTFGGMLGNTIGSVMGSFIDQNLFGTTQVMNTSGRRMSDIAIQSSAYGEMIPIIYGVAHVAGNIIWATEIREIPHTSRRSMGGKGGKVKQIHTNYKYTISVAIALCEGKITSINKIFADSKPIDLTLYNIRIYKGSEDQMPDTLIESKMGIDNAPAYRGLSYVVFEDLSLNEFGNRIPNFTFEVLKSVVGGTERVEDLIESMVIIPGCGEFVYDTLPHQKFDVDFRDNGWIQRGKRKFINQNNMSGKADALVSLDNMSQILPNIKWVAPVVSWFGTSIDIKNCQVMPGVEHKANIMTQPSVWRVGKYDRNSAHAITTHEGRAIYGGTPSDESILRYLGELKMRGYNVMFYPMLFIDTLDKPWRGHLKGDAKYIPEFFARYSEFILHYARLTKGKVDAFIIASEFKALNAINVDDTFPAVTELVKLAYAVKKILGDKVKISYAADWSEYHHTDSGWHHLDELWSCESIDFIGIDAYFPLTNETGSQYDLKKIQQAWGSGEGYDFYYTDDTKTTSLPLTPEWAWKNIQWWWSNSHIDPNGKKTAWVPKSKKIWFTEYGFPSIDSATNQPNVFYDPSTSESKMPIHSNGDADFLAQRTAIHATLKLWQNSEMIEQKFLWTWDARPYPFWPNATDVWSDGACWLKGHWVNGKMGLSTLGQIILDLLSRSNLRNHDIDVSQINDTVEGMCLNSINTIKSIISMLQSAYFFDMVEHDRKLYFLTRNNKIYTSINESDLVEGDKGTSMISIKRSEELELPSTLNVKYYAPNHQLKTVSSKYHHTSSCEMKMLSVPITFCEGRAKLIADIALCNMWLERTQLSFMLPTKWANLKPCDLLNVRYHKRSHLIRITNINFTKNRALKIEGVYEDPNMYNFVHTQEVYEESDIITPIAATKVEILDIPHTRASNKPRVLIAACGLNDNWQGASVYASIGDKFDLLTEVKSTATIGATIDVLDVAHSTLIDYASRVTVNLLSGKLKSATFDELLNYANIAVIGNEIIQFATARLVGDNQYELSQFLRGRFGTESEIKNHYVGDRFVLLDECVESVDIDTNFIGKRVLVKAMSFGATEYSKTQEFDFKANNLKPLSPCHLSVIGDRLEWVRRTRGNGEWKDNIDVPTYEHKEEYLINLDGNILITDQPFIDISGAKHIEVAQMSQTVGKGFSATISI